ncbi:MAG: lipopolysaccharide biosynthesis protein [Anaerolineaceae bacterium]
MTTRRALAWSFAERYASFFVTMASLMWLARLLTPAEVGVYSLCAAFIAVAGILRDFGVSEYLIQERTLSREKMRAASAIALTVAWTLGAVTFFGRGAVARFYEEPGVAQVLAILSLHFFLLPITSPAFALLNRELAFHRIFLLQIACNVAQAVISVTLALRGHSYLALAWGPVANVATQTVMLAYWRPKDSFILPGWREARTVLRFGGMYVASRVLETLARNSHEPVIAKQFDFVSVGLFSRAQGMIEMFHHNVSDAVVRVSTPVFAEDHRNGRPIAESFSRSTAIFVSISWPFFGFIALCSEPIIRVLFGQQWTSAAPLASILAMAAIPSGPFEMVPQLLSATGRVGQRLRISAIVSPVHVILVIAASFVSLSAVAAVSFVSATLSLFLGARQIRLALGQGAWQVYRACAPSAAIAIAVVVAQWIALAICRGLEVPALPALLAVGAVGSIVWAGAARALGHPAYAELQRMARFARDRGRRLR